MWTTTGPTPVVYQPWASGGMEWPAAAYSPRTVPGGTGANASAAIYEMNGVEYVAYGFGGEPGSSFALGDAVVSFALPSALSAAAAKAKAKAREGHIREQVDAAANVMFDLVTRFWIR